jgi:hypothetical protein
VVIRKFCRFRQQLDRIRYPVESRTQLVVFVSVCLVSGIALSQQQQPSVSLPLTLTDGVATATLLFGYDPTATDSLDRLLGESELPPFPPSDVFDARFVGFDIGKPLGLGTQKDFRPGTPGTAFQQIHELYYQTAPGRAITIRWNLPSNVTGIMQDLYLATIIVVGMKDTGSYTVQNPSVYSRLKMTIQYTSISSVETSKPDQFVLCQNYPNPFNPTTKIRFGVSSAGSQWVKLAVYDMLGREVAVLANETMETGEYSAFFDGSCFGTGIYFYRLESVGDVAVKSMLLLK